MRTRIIAHSTTRRRKRKRLSLQSTPLNESANKTTKTTDHHHDEFSWDKDEVDESVTCSHKSPIQCLGPVDAQRNEEKLEQMPPQVSPFPSSSGKLMEDSANGSISLDEIVLEYTNMKQGHMPELLVAFLMRHLIDLVENHQHVRHESLCTSKLMFHVQNNVWHCSIGTTKERNISRKHKNLISIAIELLLGIYCSSEDTDILTPFVTCNRYLQKNWSDVFSSLKEKDFTSANEKLGDVDTLPAKILLHALFVSKDKKEKEVEEEDYTDNLTLFQNHLSAIRNGQFNKEKQKTDVGDEIAVEGGCFDNSDHKKNQEGWINESTGANIYEHDIDDFISTSFETKGECNKEVIESQETCAQFSQDYESMKSDVLLHMRSDEDIIDDILDRTFDCDSKSIVSYVRHGRVIIPLYDSDEDKIQS